MAFYNSRIVKLRIIIFFLGIALIMRLFYLQVIHGEQLAIWGLSSRVEELSLSAIRGDILDAQNKPFTNIEGRYNLVIFPSQLENSKLAADQLAEVLRLPVHDIYEKIKASSEPFCLQFDIPEDRVSIIQNMNLPGVMVVRETLRYRPGLASHVLGYLNRADNEGVSGIEAMYDGILRGGNSQTVAALVDGGDRIIPGLGYKRLMASGHASHVILTLNRSMQIKVEAIMDRTMLKGSVVVMKPGTGEVLVMASRPNFDANRLSTYLVHNTAPLMNRAITPYQPGSVFKIVVAAAALENKLVQPNTVFFDQGYIDINNIRFKGWDFDKGARGKITFAEALAFSSNPVFIEVGQKVGASQIVEYAQRLGFGRQHLYLPGESEGNIPDPESLYLGDLANFSIGQGTLETTPLQVATCMATVVNDGIEVKPYIVSQLVTSEGVVVKRYSYSPGQRVISPKTAKQLKEMLKGVTTYGTGQAAFVPEVGSAGKTGSAETGRKDNNDGKGINHAWFVGYAPMDKPQYIIVVFVEEGMSGGDVAAPIFREIAEALLNDFS